MQENKYTDTDIDPTFQKIKPVTQSINCQFQIEREEYFSPVSGRKTLIDNKQLDSTIGFLANVVNYSARIGMIGYDKVTVIPEVIFNNIRSNQVLLREWLQSASLTFGSNQFIVYSDSDSCIVYYFSERDGIIDFGINSKYKLIQ